MVNYKVTVYNSERFKAYTREYIYITLVGEKGPIYIFYPNLYLFVKTIYVICSLKVTITTEESLGKLQQVVVQKEKGRLFYFNDNWLPTKIAVDTDTNETYIFPLYTWIADNEKHYFREGQGLCNYSERIF
uniref:PLAT domain-containing protein n=1 Tax=Cyprinodon variegatus TaxID=28743 RepID=A0A3Q2DDR5_CYPVA